MEKFIITPSFDKSGNTVLRQSVNAFYHGDYCGGGNYKEAGTLENMIWNIKNDSGNAHPYYLDKSVERFRNLLRDDLEQIYEELPVSELCVCCIPRSKNESFYASNQTMFRTTVHNVVAGCSWFEDGSMYILRQKNTRTTHKDRIGNGGDGEMPYAGITKDTCFISPNVRGKDILLIDDIYTKTVNIDEDCLQALLDNGAKSVYFYSIGKTVLRNDR